MRSVNFVILLCAVLLASTLFAEDFAGFRIPEHRVKNVTGTLGGRFNSREDNYPVGLSDYSSTSRQWDANGSLSGSGYYLWDSDPWRLRLNANGAFSGTRSRSQTHQMYTYGLDSRSDFKRKYASEQWQVSGDARKYPWTIPVGFLTHFSGLGAYGQDWENHNSESRDPRAGDISFGQNFDNSGQWTYHYEVSVDVGAGFGRVRDVSPVYDIYILQKRLLDLGAITREPSPAAKQKLQDLYYFQNAYSTVHDRSTKFFWQEVENILRADGVLKNDHLDAYALYRLSEKSFSSNVGSSDGFAVGEEHGKVAPGYRTGNFAGNFLRQNGYFVGIIGEVVHYNDISRGTHGEHSVQYAADTLVLDTTYASQLTHRTQTADVNSVGAMAEYHLPLGVHWQFDALSQLLLPQRKGYSHAFILRNQAAASYLIDDRWRMDFAFSHARQKFSYGKASVSYVTLLPDSWFTQAQAGLSYFIEDHLNLSLTLAQNQSSHTIGGFNVMPGYAGLSNAGFERTYTISVGASYHFLGRLDAPGIVTASTLMPWPN